MNPDDMLHTALEGAKHGDGFAACVAIIDLDNWIRSGGQLPAAWRRNDDD